MKLRIVSVNDVYLLDNLPRLRSLVRHAAEVDPADALLVFVAGDFLSPSLLSSLDAGSAMVDCLNALGVTHVTFGNHEDDLATDDLRKRVHEFRGKWLATNVQGLDAGLPSSDIVEVAGVRVGVVGVVMNDRSVYRRAPFGGAAVENPNDAAIRETERLFHDEGCAFVVPLTHQTWAADRALAAAQRGRWYPVICGGHEHQPGVEEVAGTFVVKAGSEAVRAAVIDIVTNASGVHATVRLEEVAAYPEDPALKTRVTHHMDRVRALEQATLLALGEGVELSSVGTRSRQTSMGTLLATRIRDVVEAEGCVVNGGGIRGARSYVGAFTYGALKTEIPFDNEIVVVALPGAVLRDAIAASRSQAPLESGAFLQVDDGMRVGPDHQLVSIAGEPLDLTRAYRIALVRNLFVGLDGIEPLERYGREHPERVPPDDSGRPIRELLVHAFAVSLWHELGGFDVVDSNRDGRVTPSEVALALGKTRGQEHPEVVADLVVRALDTDVDQVISPEEARAVTPRR